MILTRHLVHNFEETDIDNSYEATLIQNAMPKTKAGVHEELSQEMRLNFEREVQSFEIFFIDILSGTDEASFLIKNKGPEYHLVRNRGFMGAHDDRPLLFYQPDPREFIKQLEYIAQWQATLELENLSTDLRSDDF